MAINTLKEGSFINKKKVSKKQTIKSIQLSSLHLPILTGIFYSPTITTKYFHLPYIFLDPNNGIRANFNPTNVS